jgi:hypothetical protein
MALKGSEIVGIVIGVILAIIMFVALAMITRRMYVKRQITMRTNLARDSTTNNMYVENLM